MGDLNIKSSTIDKGLDLAKEFFGKLLGPAISEHGEIWADNVRVRRMANQIKNINKVKTICEEQNIPLREVNLKVIAPYLEGVALEEDETLQDIWANLFTNYIDAKRRLASHVYPMILQQLSSDDVKLLRQMEAQRGVIAVVHRATEDERFCTIADLSNLERLGLVIPIPKYKGNSTIPNDAQKTRDLPEFFRDRLKPAKAPVSIEQLPSDRYALTYFGQQFMAACKR